MTSYSGDAVAVLAQSFMQIVAFCQPRLYHLIVSFEDTKWFALHCVLRYCVATLNEK